MKASHIAILITASNIEEAEKISRALLEEKRVACVNIVKDVSSYFWWQGKIDQAQEALLIVKTRRILLPEIIARVKTLHSYSVPEVIALPIIEGNKDYLEWVDQSTSDKERMPS